MGPRSPLPWLITFAACAAGNPAPAPLDAPGSVASPPLVNPRTPDDRRPEYLRDVDELFRALEERATRGGPATGTTPATVAAYRENLETCLDGRWFAFC